MPSTLTSTGVTFSDGTSQNTAAGGGVTKTRVEMYTAGATHTLQSGTEFIEIHAVGGGGQGPSGNAGGGGGGGYASAIIQKSVSIPNVNSFAVNVGAGSTKPANTNVYNNAGASSVGGYVVANGGNKGNSGTNAGNGGTGGTGAVNFSSPLDSHTGTGGNGGGGSSTANGSGIRGNIPANYGGGGGGKSSNGYTYGSAAMSKYPFMGNNIMGHQYPAPGTKTSSNNYNVASNFHKDAPHIGQGGSGYQMQGIGGDGIVVIIEYGS